MPTQCSPASFGFARVESRRVAAAFDGGAMTSDEVKPGPLYLQGDHTNIDYRNIVLRPVVK